MQDDNHGLSTFQFVVVHHRNPETESWQLGITFDGEHLNWIAASQDRNRLFIWEEELQRRIPPGEPFQKAKALALLNELYEHRESDPQPPPEHVERMYLLNRTWGKK
jgi:hypothetical protein